MKSLELWWKYKGKYYLSDFKLGIKNIWYWLPIIWKDRDYDYNYIYTILEYKLRKQSSYIFKRNTFVSSKQSARNMLICAELIKLVKEDFYNSEYINYFESTFDFIPTEKKEYFEMVSNTTSENFDLYFKKYPLVYKRILNGEGVFKGMDKKTIAMNISKINNDRAKRLLFSILECEINRWWV